VRGREGRVGHHALEIAPIGATNDGVVLRELHAESPVAERLDGRGVTEGAHQSGVGHDRQATGLRYALVRLGTGKA